MFLRITLALLLLVANSLACWAAEYKTYTEAMNAAAQLSRARNFPAMLEPLEAALKLAPDDRSRLQVHMHLLTPSRLLPDHVKFMTTCEYILDNGSLAQRSIVRRDLINFIRQRGQADALILHYETRLKQNADDRIALMILGEAHATMKRDPETSIKYFEQLIELDSKSETGSDITLSAELAQQYVAAKRFEDGAKLYEKIAPLDEKTTAWYWKEAATAWKNAGDSEKSLAAATQSSAAAPETRSELLTYFWNDALGDIFADGGDKAKAKSHYEAALKSAKIDGHIKKTQEKLSKL